MFESCWTFDQFAEELGVSPKATRFYGYTNRGQSISYRTFELPKAHGGTRTICSPAEGLYFIQKRILDYVLTPENLNIRQCVFSYTKDKSAMDMASRHINRDFVVRIDLRHFFDTITFPRILGALTAFPLKIPANWATVIARLCTYQGSLPQGAPTSPALSNLVARRMDGELIRFAKENGFRYSRYSDDLVFSANTRRKLALLVERDPITFAFVAAEPVASIIRSNHFNINESKTKVSFRKNKQIVVGNIVNKKLNVDRKYVRQIRTLLHLASKSPADALCAHHKWSGSEKSQDISSVIRGKIEYVRAVKGPSDSVFVSLAEGFNRVFLSKRPITFAQPEAKDQGRYSFRHALVCNAFHPYYGDKNYENLHEADIYKTGSCFLLDGVGIVTSFHNILHNFKIFSIKNPAFTIDIREALYCSDELDIAILPLPPILKSFMTPLRAEEWRPVLEGDPVTIIGYPFYCTGDKMSQKSGKISQVKSRFGHQLYAVDVSIKEGESGGPVFNDRGRVIGLVRSNFTDNFIVPIRYVLEASRGLSTPRELAHWEKDFVNFEGTKGFSHLTAPQPSSGS